MPLHFETHAAVVTTDIRNASHQKQRSPEGASSPLPAITISGKGKQLLVSEQQAREGLERIAQKVFEDPEFAATAARNAAYGLDLLYRDSLPDLSSQSAIARYRKETSEHNAEMTAVREQRIALYESLKAEGAEDREIYRAMMEFNRELPEEYRTRTNMQPRLDACFAVADQRSA